MSEPAWHVAGVAGWMAIWWLSAVVALEATALLPIVLLLVTTLTGALIFSAGVLALLGLLAWAIDAALLWFGWRTFRRNKLATQI